MAVPAPPAQAEMLISPFLHQNAGVKNANGADGALKIKVCVSACAHADGFERRDKLANKAIKIIKMLNKGEDGGEPYKGLGGTSGSWDVATGWG